MNVAARDPAIRTSIHANGVEVFYVPRAGWASHALGYHEGIGPYFSLPEALRRAEAQIGEAVWRPKAAEGASSPQTGVR